MKKLLYISIVILISIKGFSQTFADKKFYLVDSLVLSELSKMERLTLDSCLKIVHSSVDDTTKITAIGHFIEMCENNEVWPKYNNWIADFSTSQLKKNLSRRLLLFYKTKLAGTTNNLGYFYEINGDINNALKTYKKSLQLQEELIKIDDKNNENYAGVAAALNNIGNIYLEQGLFSEAIDYFFKSLENEEKINNRLGMASSLNNIGACLDKQRQYDDALKFFNKSLAIRIEENDKRGMGTVYNNMGLAYDNKGLTDKALEYYLKSLKVREEIEDKSGIATSLNNIGFLYYQTNNPEKAFEYCTRSLQLREELGQQSKIASTLNNLGQIELKLKNITSAKKIGERALTIAKELGYTELIEINAGLLYEIAELQGNYPEALKMRNLEILMRDSITNADNQKNTLKNSLKYEFDKQKTLDDAEHEKQLAVEKEAKAKQKIITFATAGGLGLVAIFLLFVFNRLQVTRKQKAVIEEQKTVVEKVHHELVEKNKEIMDSITYAKRIQSAILPPQKRVKEYLPDSFILYKPKDIVAGDFYWMESLSAINSIQSSFHSPLKTENCEHILFAAADCTGHGVPGAMVSVVCNNGLNRSVREYGLTDPGKILDKTREIVIQEFEKSDEEVKDGMDISLCGLDLSNNVLTWAGANNPLWIIRANQHSGLDPESHEIIEYKADKQPIGKYAEAKPFTTHQIQLQKGDSIYIFTDGYQDQFGGEKGKKFKAAKLRELLLSIQYERMEKQQELIDQSFEAWKGNLEQVDDVCVIGVRI